MSNDQHAIDNAKGWLERIVELADAVYSDDDETREAAEQEIREAPLSVMVRDGWREPSAPATDGAEEYEILLSTGGPALRLTGKLDRGTPEGWARLEWQDWGTPWTEYVPARAHSDRLQTFASQFYFGD